MMMQNLGTENPAINKIFFIYITVSFLVHVVF